MCDQPEGIRTATIKQIIKVAIKNCDAKQLAAIWNILGGNATVLHDEDGMEYVAIKPSDLMEYPIFNAIETNLLLDSLK